MQRTFLPSSPANAIRLLYKSVFSQLTTRNWLNDVVSMEEIIPTLKEALKRAELPVEALTVREQRMREEAEHLAHHCDFFDFIRFMRHSFHGVSGTPAALVCKAVVQKMHATWPLTLSDELLSLAKGQVQHLADGLAPKELGELELSCLILRPSMRDGTAVIHIGTGQFGELVGPPGDDLVKWRTWEGGASELIEPDCFALLPVTPLLRSLPLSPKSPFPRVTSEDVWNEFRTVFPY